jgi:hypothetical protein
MGEQLRSRQEAKKQNNRVTKISLALLLGGTGVAYYGPELATQYRKLSRGDVAKEKDLARQALEISDDAEPKEKFEANLNFHVQALINAGESDDRVEKTKEFFIKLVDKFEVISKIEKDKKKVLFALFQDLGRYEPEKARLSDIAYDHVGNCDARAQALLLSLPAIYPDLEVKAQFFGPSQIKQAESHIRVLTKFDGDGDGNEEWYAIEGEPIEVTEEEMKGTVLASDKVFQASVAFVDSTQDLVKNTEAVLVESDQETEQNDGNFGGSTNTLFNTSVFTANATETYGEGGGVSQPETEEDYQKRIEKTPKFHTDTILPIELSLLDEENEEKYGVVPLPEKILEEARKKGKLILSDWDVTAQKSTKLPFFDLSPAFEDEKIERIIIHSSDKEVTSMYYEKFNLSNLNFLIFYRGAFYFIADNKKSKLFQSNLDIKNDGYEMIKMSLNFDGLKQVNFFDVIPPGFHYLQSFNLYYDGKIKLPNFGDKLESAVVSQRIENREDIISLENLKPLFGKKLKNFKIHVLARDLDVRIPFDREDLVKKEIISDNAEIDIWFEKY